MVKQRWAAARESRYTDGGRAVRALKRTWQSPGLIAVAAGDTAIKLLLFMSAEARGRWEKQGDSLRSRHYRNQAFAPPRYVYHRTQYQSVFTATLENWAGSWQNPAVIIELTTIFQTKM